MDLKDRKWKSFLISDIFEVKRGLRLKEKDRETGIFPLVVASGINNGIISYINNIKMPIYLKNSITLDMFGNSFLQLKEFKADDNIIILNNNNLNKYNGLFIVSIFKKIFKNKYNFGNQLRLFKLREETIKLPINEFNQPDWYFMEEYIKNLEYNLDMSFIEDFYKKETKLTLKDREWKDFNISDIFEVEKGQQISLKDIKLGETPFITTTDKNNGVLKYIDKTNYITYKNCLTVSNNGACGSTFYHDYEFVVNSDVSVMFNNKLNKFNSLFISTLITKQIKPKYNYVQKLGLNKLKNETIKLPINSANQPDWDFMEEYIKERS